VVKKFVEMRISFNFVKKITQCFSTAPISVIGKILRMCLLWKKKKKNALRAAILRGRYGKAFCGGYQIMSVGWNNKKRVYFCLLHLDIKNDKIWLQENSTDYDIVEDLVKLGVPNSDVVLGFILADVRPFTEYAVA
jgi:XisI protein